MRGAPFYLAINRHNPYVSVDLFGLNIANVYVRRAVALNVRNWHAHKPFGFQTTIFETLLTNIDSRTCDLFKIFINMNV